MANIMDSLFGPTPYDVGQQRNQQDMSYAEKVARMGGFEQAKFGIGQGAAGMTRAGAGMMGMVDPLQQEAAMREQVMAQGGDLTTSAGLKAKALQFAQAGDQRTAMKLAIAAKEAEAREQAMIVEAQKQALAERKQNFNETEAFELKKREAEARIQQNQQRIDDARTSAADRAALLRENNQIKLLLGQAMIAAKRDAVAANGPKLTKGQEASDREFGKEYAQHQAAGGFSDVEKQLKQLGAVAAELEKEGNDYTGPVVGLVPDKARAFTNQAAVDAKNKVEEVAQRNLRLVLGAQFTQVEGERLIARAYNPSLDPKTNALRVRALENQIRIAAKQKQAAIDYFEENGTLSGFKGAMPTLSDFEEAIDKAAPKQSASGKISPKGKSALDAALEKY